MPPGAEQPGPQRATTIRLETDRLVDRLQEEAKRATIHIIDGSSADLGRHETLDQPHVIGRGEEASFQITDSGASRVHAWIGWDDSPPGFTVRDLGSTNGTYVNGEAIDVRMLLNHGDQVAVGNTVLEFRMADDQEIRNREQIEAWLSTDDLTGLLNKRSFDGAMRRAASSLNSEDIWITAMMLDLDNLKSINDAHGHHVGSRTIAEVGRVIGQAVHGKGGATRFGGDEFTVYLVGHDLAAARALAESIRGAVESLTIETETGEVNTTISIGIASGPSRGLDCEKLCLDADRALYRAKQAGRNQVSE